MAIPPPPGFVTDSVAPPPGFVAGAPIETESQKLSFAKRAGKRLFERQKVAEEIIAATAEGEQSYAEGVVQLIGKVGVGGVFDFLGEGLVSTARVVSNITPDPIEDRVVESARNTGRVFLSTPVGQAGMLALEQGMESYREFAKEHPRAARNIESVVNIGLLAAPVSRSAKPVTEQTTAFGRGAEALNRSAATQESRIRADFVDDLITPEQTKKVRLDQTSRTTEHGLLRQKQVALSPQEAVISNEVNAISGVSTSKTLQGNLNAIREELGVVAGRLLAGLERSNIPITHIESRQAVEGVRAGLKDVPTLVGNPATTANKLIDNALVFINRNPQTSAGLLKARQEFDNFLLSQKRNVLGDVPLENAMTIAAAEVRQAMNGLIAAKNPSAGVRASLNSQTNMFRAMDNIAPKAAEEASNIVIRAWQNAMKILPFRGEFNQLMATGFGIGGLGASARFAPVFTGIVTLGGISYVGGRAVLSAGAKKAGAALLAKVDDAIKVATNAEMIKQLRADRALLIELVKEDK